MKGGEVKKICQDERAYLNKILLFILEKIILIDWLFKFTCTYILFFLYSYRCHHDNWWRVWFINFLIMKPKTQLTVQSCIFSVYWYKLVHELHGVTALNVESTDTSSCNEWWWNLSGLTKMECFFSVFKKQISLLRKCLDFPWKID